MAFRRPSRSKLTVRFERAVGDEGRAQNGRVTGGRMLRRVAPGVAVMQAADACRGYHRRVR
jgi:hypothetical protein